MALKYHSSSADIAKLRLIWDKQQTKIEKERGYEHKTSIDDILGNIRETLPEYIKSQIPVTTVLTNIIDEDKNSKTLYIEAKRMIEPNKYKVVRRLHITVYE